MSIQRECRCCRVPIPAGQLACRFHWIALPRQLRKAITSTYLGGQTESYVANVREAERIWRQRDMWQRRPEIER